MDIFATPYTTNYFRNRSILHKLSNSDLRIAPNTSTYKNKNKQLMCNFIHIFQRTLTLLPN